MGTHEYVISEEMGWLRSAWGSGSQCAGCLGKDEERGGKKMTCAWMFVIDR